MSHLKPQLTVPLLALVFVLLAAGSASKKSLTWDEPTFITSGYTYLDRSDFRLNPEAPPLLQELAALPIWLGSFTPPDYDHPAWSDREQVAFAKDFVSRNRDRIADLAWWSRAPTWVLGGCLVIVGAAFCMQIAGPNATIICALLTAVSPNLLAHGRLATTDLGCAALMFGAVWCFKMAIEKDRLPYWIIAGAVAGLALLTKYTALLLIPTFLILGFYEWLTQRRPIMGLLIGFGILATSSVAMLFIGYDFGFGPALYLEGTDSIYSHYMPGFRFYLLGNVLEKPVWYYHLVALLLKTPEPTICLGAISVWATMRSTKLRSSAIYLITPMCLVIAASFFDQAHLGLRRILPIYPFMFALVAIAGSDKPCRFCKQIYFGLVVWACLASALAYPHYLSYSNVLSGGSANAPYLLEDSNVDWGQDLPALADWQSRNPDQSIKLKYFGTAVPSHYGVRSERMPDSEVIDPLAGVYAISAHNLVYFRKIAHQTRRPDIDWLSRYKPFDRAGGSIYLYRFP